MEKEFALCDILTITTGRLLTKPEAKNDNGIANLYKILEHMTGESPFTHTLGRFSEECKPHLLKSFPELSNANLEELDKGECTYEWINSWIERCVNEWGMKPAYMIGQISKDSHESKNPIVELSDMMSKP